MRRVAWHCTARPGETLKRLGISLDDARSGVVNKPVSPVPPSALAATSGDDAAISSAACQHIAARSANTAAIVE